MKKVLQHFFGKITILVSMLCAFAYTGMGQAHITMSTANCTISATEVQMDILVTNDGTGGNLQDLRWNSCVLRMVVPAGMLPVGGTYSFQCVGAGDFPLSWPAVLPANAFGASYAAGTRTITWTTGNTSAYNNLTCTAPLIPAGATRTIGRFSFACTNGTFVAGQPATFTWSATSSCNLYQTSPTCATAVTGFSTATLRTQGPPCPLAVPSSCAVTGSATTTSPSCFGGTDGTATVTLAGAGSGAPGNYSLDGGPSTNPYATNPFTITGLSAGPHTVVATVTAGGCVSSSIDATVTATPALTGTATTTPTTCFGGTDGSATVTLSASTSGTYSVDGGPGLPYNTNPFTVSGLSGGSHNIVATSTAGCASNSIAANVGSPAALTGTASTTAVSCFGNTNGTATVTLSASTSGTYSVDGGPATAYATNPFTVNGLAAGPHSIVATSAAGCASNSISANVGNTAALTGTATSTPVSCAGATDGTATVTLSASTSGTYTVDGGAPVAYNSNPFTVNGLGGGSHTIVATSAAGCTSDLIGVTVGSPAALTGSGTTTPTTCGNPTSGTATITLSGSTSGTYKVDGGSSVPYNSNPFTITGLTAGNHTIVATSSAGCVSSNIVVNVGASATFTASYVKTNLTACNATQDGTITVSTSGGVGPYSYAWSGETGSNHTPFTAGNVPNLTGLNYGYYNVTITDLGGCGSVTFTNIHVEFAYYVYVTNSGTSSSACGNTGSILLYGNAGVTPYTYAVSAGSSQPTPAPGAFQASNSFTGLAAGNYTGFIKDAGGCVSSKNITVTAAPAIVVNPFPVGASSCAPDGSVQIFRTGGTPPYTYSLSVGAGPAGTFQVSNTFTGLAAGPYTAYVKDAAGCIGSQTTTVAAGTGVSATISKVNSSTCVNDGSIQVNATGGVAPYSYSFNSGAYQPGNAIGSLAAGNYTAQVKDSKGCLSPVYNITISLNTIVVTASPTASATCTSNNGKIQLFRTGGYGPYTYSIDGNTYFASSIFLNLAPGTYTGYVKDSKTCIGFLSGIVVGPNGCPPPPIVSTGGNNNVKYNAPVRTALKVQAYPNPTASEFTLVLEGYSAKEKVSVTVTDLLGRKVYQVEATGRSQYRFGSSFIAGMYNVQVIQGAEKASLKLVKE